MKKIISMVLALATAFTMVVPASAETNENDDYIRDEFAFASNFSAQEGVDIELSEESGVIIHEIKLPSISNIVNNVTEVNGAEEDDVDRIITEQGNRNVQIIKNYISGLNLTEQEKNIQCREIDEAGADGYVDGYKIYTTVASSTDYTYYGTYSGMRFYQRPSSDISVNYKKETERNISNLNKWISMTADIVLTIEEMAPISMAVTVLSIGKKMFSDNYTARSGDYTEYYVRTVRRIREIGILDADSGGFQTVMVDNKVDMYPYSVFHFADPSIYNCSAAVTEYMDDWRTVYSQYYNNKSYNLKAAYEQRTERPDIILYMQGVVVNSKMFTWELK